MEWQPIDTAPKRVEVLVAKGEHTALGILLRNHPYLEDEYSKGYRWQVEGNEQHSVYNPTHWMPKPKPPSTDN